MSFWDKRPIFRGYIIYTYGYVSIHSVYSHSIPVWYIECPTFTNRGFFQGSQPESSRLTPRDDPQPTPRTAARMTRSLWILETLFLSRFRTPKKRSIKYWVAKNGGFSPTHPRKICAFVKLGIIFPKDRGENNRYLSCHHLGWFIWGPFLLNDSFGSISSNPDDSGLKWTKFSTAGNQKCPAFH